MRLKNKIKANNVSGLFCVILLNQNPVHPRKSLNLLMNKGIGRMGVGNVKTKLNSISQLNYLKSK